MTGAVTSRPTITAAVTAAAVGLGLTVHEEVNTGVETDIQHQQAEVELENSEIVAESIVVGKQLVLTRGDVTIRVHRDERGQCRVCAESKGHTQAELKQMAEEFSQKMIQCFAYHRTVSELKSKNFQMVNEEAMEDGTIRLHVRHWVD